MSISLTILYISVFSAFRAYEVGGAEIGVTENLFSGATPIFASTALLSESRIVLFESVDRGGNDDENIGVSSSSSLRQPLL